jgi:hypothetical protein
MGAVKTLETAQRVTGELVRQSLQRGTPVRMRLATASMSPDLLPGDELIIEAREWQKLKTGDIVLFERNEALLAHRLIRVERRHGGVRLITKGDAVASYDSPVSIASYLGRVARVARGGHIINLQSWGARAGARLRVLRSVSRTMITRLTHNIHERLGIVTVLMLALALFGVRSAAAAVTISSFAATGGGGKIVLSWTTATELGNFGFNVERSTDQKNWIKITATPVQSYSLCNSSVTGNSYNYTDDSSSLVLTTTYYYRLQSLGKQCGDSDEYYDRIVSAAPNGTKNPVQATATPTPPATATTQPAATPTTVPPTAAPTNVPQATSTDTPQAQDTPAATSTPPANAPRFTPTATLTGVTHVPTAADGAATQPAGTEQPTDAIATDTPAADASTATPAQTEVAIVVASDTPSPAGPQGSSRPVQLQPTPAPAAASSLLVGLGLLGVLGMGAAGFLLLGMAGILIWRFYARG